MPPRVSRKHESSSRWRTSSNGRASLLRSRPFLGVVLALAAAAILPLPAAAAGLDGPAATHALAAAPGYWGGPFTASTGERVTIRVSDRYPQDTALPQRWADFLARLVHGPELSSVVVYLAPLDEVQSYCGRSALACYSATARLLVAPAEDPASDISAESVVMHEYGHHVAASRNDAPWPAVDWGTKRWASYVQVCSRTRAHQLFPGSEDGETYRLNPGEGFAESYRLLNERRAGLPESAWDVVSHALYPDDRALALLQEDVTNPWSGNSVATATASLTRAKRVRTVPIATPLDGALRITVRAARGERVTVDVLTSSGTRAGHVTASGTAARAVGTTVCGSRSYRVRLSLLAGAGSVRLSVSKP